MDREQRKIIRFSIRMLMNALLRLYWVINFTRSVFKFTSVLMSKRGAGIAYSV
jgi:hypothetical protein